MKMHSRHDLDLAKRDGVAAHATGRRRAACPFDLRPLWRAWLRGWVADQKAKRRAYKLAWQRNARAARKADEEQERRVVA